MNELRKRKAISPVIATVILVAVAITIAVAVSYWMGSIASQYTKFEKVEIQSAQITKETGYWKVTFTLKNSGSASATINSVFINDAVAVYSETPPVATSIGYATGTGPESDGEGAMTITSGALSNSLIVYIGTSYKSLSSGTAVNIRIHSAGGMEYIKLIELV